MNIENKIGRRDFLRKADKYAVGIIGSGGILALLVRALKEDIEKVKAFEEERRETGGYQIENLGDGLLKIQLLPSGKSTLPFFGGKDIRSETVSKALRKIQEGNCVVESVEAIESEENFFKASTDSLLVKVRNCR